MAEEQKNEEGHEGHEGHEVKELTLEDLRRVRGGMVADGETALDDYNRDRCYKKCNTEML